MKKLVQIAPGMFNWVEVPVPEINRPRAESGCIHFGCDLGETISCPTCRGNVQIKLFQCNRFGRCTLKKAVPGVACCNGTINEQTGLLEPCEGFESRKTAEGKKPLETVHVMEAHERSPVCAKTWAYGVTTVKSRLDTTLLTTLASLANAGFPDPLLFIDDGAEVRKEDFRGATIRSTRLGTLGNWALALWELYVRNPRAERFAIFQDDVIAVRNLRSFLDASPFPEKGYLNLYQYGEKNKGDGWHEAACLEHPPSPTYHNLKPQGGRGALALVFDRDGVTTLLSSPHLIARPQDTRPANRRPGWTKGMATVDGCIVESMNQAGWREWVFSPSLVQHIGFQSSMYGRRHPSAPDFPGEDYDALQLLK